VLVPLGKIEQHGPHLPVGTDVIVPMEIAKRVAEKAKVLVAPPIYYGNSLSMQEIRELSRSLPKPSQPCSLTYVSLLRNRVLGRSCS